MSVLFKTKCKNWGFFLASHTVWFNLIPHDCKRSLTVCQERLIGVYQELGSNDLQPLPLALLLEHPVIQEAISQCTVHKVVVSGLLLFVQPVFASNRHRLTAVAGRSERLSIANYMLTTLRNVDSRLKKQPVRAHLKTFVHCSFGEIFCYVHRITKIICG